MYTRMPSYRTMLGTVIVPMVDDKLRRFNVYVPFWNSTEEGIEKAVRYFIETRKGTPPREDFTRGS